MAKRYGGRFSPDGQDTAQEQPKAAEIRAPGMKSNLLFVPAVILVFTSLNETPQDLVLGLVAAGALTFAAWLLREGLKAEAAYNARKVARRPALPRKMLATALTGAGAALAAYSNDTGVVGSALYAVAAAGLHVTAFGIDPLKDKRMEGIDARQQDRVAKVVDEAQNYLDAMKDQIDSLGDSKLTARVASFQVVAHKMIRTVEEDPRDLTGARKFLGVYLMGARDATVKFVDLYKRNKDADARDKYDALLDDLEHNFDARTQKMLLDDRSDMDIEINVLRDRLQREGVSLNLKGNR
ncbi:5-bromo-4-chloroindolyl phosphate hydrolysis family protein [Yoonia sediminilitoris]|uniref:5-bromo-4-chloroindolyl phosphate hydrolysis protein n=1 Tax=Yoonia sediminilitoris TaxID=1286148 RepID=A0A2T6KPZ7_9RHOB|nr:5-bromo-4-chloroindolyl phosphate hydrolysis family protein [Yoonia sediminilitoris]PUB18630.1 5-bromo-4-chloroindolyl phosphate hydrolysis protein [Yoonia sediminilitoris]RCW98798.1 5-bromo-4-chloroindolyl phosphate hydrolysis protein [Yoonia sediminilitoris]